MKNRGAACKTVAAGSRRYFGYAGMRMMSAASCVAHQSESVASVFWRRCTSRWPSHAMHGTAMELPIAL